MQEVLIKIDSIVAQKYDQSVKMIKSESLLQDFVFYICQTLHQNLGIFKLQNLKFPLICFLFKKRYLSYIVNRIVFFHLPSVFLFCLTHFPIGWDMHTHDGIALGDLQDVILFKSENILTPKVPTKFYPIVCGKKTKSNRIEFC